MPDYSKAKLSFEELVQEITKYKNVLEQTYLDADNDEWHGDGMPQKFRSQDHTYEEMKIALARFIGRVHRHEEQVERASLAFRSARDALPDYQKYMKVLRVYNNSDPKSVEEVRLSWQSCLKAYENMPEHKAFMVAKKRQALFYPLTTRQPSREHIQELIDSMR